MATSPTATTTAGKRLFVAVATGVIVGALVGTTGYAAYAALAAWDVAAAIYVGWTLFVVLKFSAADTRLHALREDPGRALADAVLIFASLASLAAIGFLVFQGRNDVGIDKAIDIGLSLLSVVVSWSAVHTTYLLKYARLYYGDPEGGVNFNNNSAPGYSDFAYMAFTVGMTFQIADTDLKTKEFRALVLKHALLSFVFGTVIIATTINTLASLSQ
jgi:uncharacterized membrane protein